MASCFKVSLEVFGLLAIHLQGQFQQKRGRCTLLAHATLSSARVFRWRLS